jgi:hypothetical protein
MSGLRERLDDDITAAFRQYESYHYARQAGIVNIAADAALATFRQWLADQGLVCVPKKCTDDMAGYAGARAEARGDIRMLPGEYRNAWAAMIAAAPDALGDGP